MRSQLVVAITFAVAVALLVGCDSEPDSSTGKRKSYPLPPPPGLGGAGPSGSSSESGSATAAPAADAVEPEAVPSDSPAPAEEDMERVKADVGAAKAGRSLDEYEGFTVTPAKSLFAVRERMVFQAQIPSALKLYKATNGNNPKSHEEFMTKIIEAGQIQLPELPAGQRYAYDPEKGELMVEKPR